MFAGLLPEERATLREGGTRREWYVDDPWTGGDPDGDRRRGGRRRGEVS